jgi:hypothetical protein
MRWSRVQRVLAALACSAGLAVSGVVGSTAQAAVTPSSGARQAAAPIVLPPHVFEPYIAPSGNLLGTARASGARYLTLDFLQTPQPGSCTVDWNGDPGTPVGSYARSIAALQAEGGQVVPSFGGAGADSDGTELADSCHSVPAIAAAYENVITTYHVTRIDLDTEEDSLNNLAGVNRRNEAIAMVERWAARTRRTVQFVYTLPVNTTGLDENGAHVLQNAVENGARIAIVDVMTFDYYDNLPHEMADNAQTAAIAAYNVLHRLYPAKSPAQLWGMIGVCQDIGAPPNPGQDDFGAAETLTIADAHTVEQWAAARGLAELTFWNLANDNSASAPYQYSHAFEPFTSWSTRQRSSRTAPAIGSPGGPGAVVSPSGNLQDVSCPTPTFCMAIGNYGDTAISWNGQSWSRPVPIERGSPAMNLTGLSCSSARFCVAADTLGRALTWNGRSWSRPVPIDPRGDGLSAVSCPASTESPFCVAVDGAGNALVYRHGSWSRPVRVDSTGSGMQSVSCVSPSFCLAGDWNGDVVRFDGRSWTPPRLLVQTTSSTGGGIGNISCAAASFCVATDWQGSELTWTGSSWSKPVGFDPYGSGGLIAVSCRSASFCMAVDASGDAVRWNGKTWQSTLDDLTGDGETSVSCATTTFCVAVDWNGNALMWNGTSWTAPAISCPDSTASSAGTCTAVGSYTDGRAGVLSADSCPSAAFCVAVDENGNAFTWNGRSWSLPVSLDPIAGVLTSVSCASATFCVAVDGNGYAFAWNGTSWSKTAYSVTSPVDPRGGGLTSVSCPASAAGTFCVAVDTDGNALAWTGTSWSAPVAIDAAGGGLTSVSCASKSLCMAVDADGNAVTWDGTWAAPVRIDPHGGLTSVSCASSQSCVAVDQNGNAIAWNGRSWSAPAMIDPRGSGLTSVSCSPGGSCVAVDWDGDAFSRTAGRWLADGAIDSSGGGVQAVSCSQSCHAVDWVGDSVTFVPPART